MKIVMAQINTIVGDLKGNTEKCIRHIKEAEKTHADVITFPELTITGYPPEDLLFKTGFIEDNLKCLGKVVENTGNATVIVGFADRKGKFLYNAAAVIRGKKICGIHRKVFLPNYGVFDEKRYFAAGKQFQVFSEGGLKFGVSICEDIWNEETIKQQAAGGAKAIFAVNASPYSYGKIQKREELITNLAKKYGIIIFYNNLVGGQDELIFDGHGIIVDEKGRIISRGKPFEEDLITHDSEKRNVTIKNCLMAPEEEVYAALKLSLRDYTRKNNFKKVVIALSGGIDSSLVAAIAADAIGAQNVLGVFMPSQFSSRISGEDADGLARNFGIKLLVIPIQRALEFYTSLLANQFAGLPRDITEENLQARIRGNIIMAISNKLGHLVVSTGNKSEMSTGYATLYGDMAGGFALIKDVYKTLVYRLARHRNSVKPVIPQRILSRPPTAELKPDQKDQDTLPPYPLLDRILSSYIEEDKTLEEIVKEGFSRKLAEKVIKMVDSSEYKRRQAPIGPKITLKSFGKDRRMPITNKYF